MARKTLHLAIIMDGNGRWAAARGLPRLAGHHRGADALRQAVEAAPALGVSTLTVYAFSSDNWQRPPEEVSGLLELFANYLEKEVRECVRKGVRLSVIGRRDRLSPKLVHLIESSERTTARGRAVHLRVAVDYSARDLLLRAAAAISSGTREGFAATLGSVQGGGEPAPDVDLLIRTGGEQRLSDFLLWECAYAELLFLPCMWPDFGADEMRRAVEVFHSRNRRFGALPPVTSLAAEPAAVDSTNR